jgi:hypothetical protein
MLSSVEGKSMRNEFPDSSHISLLLDNKGVRLEFCIKNADLMLLRRYTTDWRVQRLTQQSPQLNKTRSLHCITPRPTEVNSNNSSSSLRS